MDSCHLFFLPFLFGKIVSGQASVRPTLLSAASEVGLRSGINGRARPDLTATQEEVKSQVKPGGQECPPYTDLCRLNHLAGNFNPLHHGTQGCRMHAQPCRRSLGTINHSIAFAKGSKHVFPAHGFQRRWRGRGRGPQFEADSTADHFYNDEVCYVWVRGGRGSKLRLCGNPRSSHIVPRHRVQIASTI